MNDSSNQLIRPESYEWPVISSADNHVEIIQHSVQVKSNVEAAAIATNLAPLIDEYDKSGSEYTLLMSLSPWRVNLNFTVPTGFWASPEQKKLTEKIIEVLQNKS